jgi:hypothetical protein
MLILKDFVSQAIEALKPFAEQYGARDQESERDVKAIRDALFPKTRTGELAITLAPVNTRFANPSLDSRSWLV